MTLQLIRLARRLIARNHAKSAIKKKKPIRILVMARQCADDWFPTHHPIILESRPVQFSADSSHFALYEYKEWIKWNKGQMRDQTDYIILLLGLLWCFLRCLMRSWQLLVDVLGGKLDSLCLLLRLQVRSEFFPHQKAPTKKSFQWYYQIESISEHQENQPSWFSILRLWKGRRQRKLLKSGLLTNRRFASLSERTCYLMYYPCKKIMISIAICRNTASLFYGRCLRVRMKEDTCIHNIRRSAIYRMRMAT